VRLGSVFTPLDLINSVFEMKGWSVRRRLRAPVDEVAATLSGGLLRHPDFGAPS